MKYLIRTKSEIYYITFSTRDNLPIVCDKVDAYVFTQKQVIKILQQLPGGDKVYEIIPV